MSLFACALGGEGGVSGGSGVAGHVRILFWGDGLEPESTITEANTSVFY
jgi:hypothetical protein